MFLLDDLSFSCPENPLLSQNYEMNQELSELSREYFNWEYQHSEFTSSEVSSLNGALLGSLSPEGYGSSLEMCEIPILQDIASPVPTSKPKDPATYIVRPT